VAGYAVMPRLRLILEGFAADSKEQKPDAKYAPGYGAG